jgi:hypothetical protein
MPAALPGFANAERGSQTDGRLTKRHVRKIPPDTKQYNVFLKKGSSEKG